MNGGELIYSLFSIDGIMRWKIEKIKRNCVEVVTEKDLKNLLEQKKMFNFYWGIAPTGPFHLGYLISLCKLHDLIEVGGKATILIADLHAYLDDKKTPWEEMEIRSKYIEKCLKLLLREKTNKIRFVRGSDFQLSKDYIADTLKLSGYVTAKRAIRAASEVVRIREAPLISSLLYPIMQNVDIKYLDAELVLGGIDQRHIYTLGREVLPKIGWKKPVCIFTPLLTSLKRKGKMSASKPETHITLHENEKVLAYKIKKAYCPPKKVENNPIMEIVRYILFPLFKKIEIKGRDEIITYESVDKLINDYKKNSIHPLDLKKSIIHYVNQLIEPVREYFVKNSDFFSEIKESMKKSGYKFF